jgi:hypothetical protein
MIARQHRHDSAILNDEPLPGRKADIRRSEQHGAPNSRGVHALAGLIVGHVSDTLAISENGMGGDAGHGRTGFPGCRCSTHRRASGKKSARDMHVNPAPQEAHSDRHTIRTEELPARLVKSS